MIQAKKEYNQFGELGLVEAIREGQPKDHYLMYRRVFQIVDSQGPVSKKCIVWRDYPSWSKYGKRSRSYGLQGSPASLDIIE